MNTFLAKPVQDWRRNAPAGVSLAAAKATVKQAPTPLPDGLSQALGKILRPQAARGGDRLNRRFNPVWKPELRHNPFLEVKNA